MVHHVAFPFLCWRTWCFMGSYSPGRSCYQYSMVPWPPPQSYSRVLNMLGSLTLLLLHVPFYHSP